VGARPVAINTLSTANRASTLPPAAPPASSGVFKMAGDLYLYDSQRSGLPDCQSASGIVTDFVSVNQRILKLGRPPPQLKPPIVETPSKLHHHFYIYTNTEVGSRPNLSDYLSSVDSRAREHGP